MNAEVNSGNRKAVLASNYATWTPCRTAMIIYKVICFMRKTIKLLNNTCILIPLDTGSNTKVEVYILQVVLNGCRSTKKSVQFFFLEHLYIVFLKLWSCQMNLDTYELFCLPKSKSCWCCQQGNSFLCSNNGFCQHYFYNIIWKKFQSC